MTELSPLAKALWVGALALLVLMFVVASSEGLKLALGGRSLFSSSSAPLKPACPRPDQLRPDLLVARLGYQAASAYLTLCRSEEPGNVFPATPGSSRRSNQAEFVRGLRRG